MWIRIDHTTQKIGDSVGFRWFGRGGGLELETLEGLLVSPGLDGEIGLGVEADAEDNDGEEASYVAGQLPVLPLARLARWQWRSVEEVSLRPLLVPRARPPARSCGGCATTDTQGSHQALAEHAGGAAYGHAWLVFFRLRFCLRTDGRTLTERRGTAREWGMLWLFVFVYRKYILALTSTNFFYLHHQFFLKCHFNT